MRFILLLSFFLLVNSILFAQQNVHQTVVWRGFEHSWTYNHRINRLGNFVEISKDKIENCHVSASGVGADSTYYTSHYTFLESPTVGFHTGVATVKLYGKEKQLLTREIEISLPAPKEMENKEQYITLLNGFDLKAINRADKIQLLRISVEDAEYAPAINEIRFYLKVALVVNCQSFECSRFNQQATYELDIHYLVAAGDLSEMMATPKMLTKQYPWGRKDEPNHLPEKHYMLGKKNPSFTSAVLGLKSIALTLDEAHWTVEFNNNVTPLAYSLETGRVDFSMDLFFKEWQQGMKSNSVRPELSKFSSKKSGWGLLDTGIILLQFKNATVSHQKHKGSLYWTGNNSSSLDPKAESRRELFFPDK